MSSAIPPGDRFGPWADGLDDAELRARCRSMQALARILCGARAVEFSTFLARGERDPEALVAAHGALNRLASRDRREILCSCSALARAA